MGADGSSAVQARALPSDGLTSHSMVDRGRPSRGRILRVVTPVLALEILLWLVLLAGAGLFRAGPNGKSLATDFAVFSGAAQAVEHGSNPYDNHVLYRYERRLMRGQHLPVTSNVQNVRAGNPPLLYWSLEPLNYLPFQTAAYVWIAGLLLISGLGLIAALRYFSWRITALPLIVFLLMPQTALGAAYANVHAVVLAALAGSLALGKRYPFWAGVVLSLTWLKPQLGLPLAALVLLFHSRDPRRVLLGFTAATASLLALTLIAVGPGLLADWIRGLASWSRTVGLEPNLSSLVGLYVGWASFPVRVALGGAILAGAAVLTWWQWSALRGRDEIPFMHVAWLWFVWFLASPFAHFPDEMLLAIPLIAYFGRDGRHLTRRGPAVALYLCFLSLALFPAAIPEANALSVVVAVVGLMLFRARIDPAYARG